MNNLDLINFNLENRCHKILLDCGGYFYVEKFDTNEPSLSFTREEEERAKIYDEFGGYLDYISVESISNSDYWSVINNLTQSASSKEFLNKLDIDEDIVLGDSIFNLLFAYAEGFGENEDEEEKSLLYERLNDKNWSEEDLIEKYNIQKVGNLYFIILA